jgi:hypothetical protein
MGDQGEYWRDLGPALKLLSQARREHNRASSTELLKARGVQFTDHNDGIHLVITHADRVVDFWPSTGKWIERAGSAKGRGVHALLKLLEVRRP